MKRKALIISNPGEDGAENYCEGVKVDVKNYEFFLMSTLGGGWYASEIIHLERPLSYKVKEELEKLKDIDYSLIIFCGHGYYSNNLDSTVIELQNNITFDTNNFRTGSKKRTVIIDCCRERFNDIEDSRILNEQIHFAKSSNSIANARIYYEEEIRKCNDSIVIMYGCDINETAGDDERKGGYYSYSLIKSAKIWSENKFIKDVLSVSQAHIKAQNMVRNLSNNNQNPKIEKQRSTPYFPFAINI